MNQASIPSEDKLGSPPFDLIRFRAGTSIALAHRDHACRFRCSLVSAVMILHGLFGPSLAPKNLATTLSWVHFRGVLVLVLLCAGNFFCLACPFMLVRHVARRFFSPGSTGRAYCETSGSRSHCSSSSCSPMNSSTSGLRPGGPPGSSSAISGVLVVDGFFKHASFCKFVCPIGQFNFIASTLSPFEVEVRDQDVCTRATRRTAFAAAATPTVRSGGNPRLRIGALSAAQSRQHGLHLLSRLRPCLPARQRRHTEPPAGK